MKGFPRLFLVLMATVAMLVSACGGSATSPVAEDTSLGSGKPLASLIEVKGYIEGISGNQWTINGQVVTVDQAMLDDDDDLSDYQVGDYIEIEAEVSTDGSLVAKEVDDSSDDGNENDDSNSNDDDLGGIGNSNDNDDDSNDNDDDSNDNDDDSNSNDNDDDSNDNDDDSNSNDDDDSNDNDDDSNSNDDDSNDNDDSDDDSDDDDNENDG